MMQAIIHRVTRSALSLLLISLLAFCIIASMPADPVMIAIRAWNLAATDETVAALRTQWGLDLPVWERYLIWLKGFVSGDWGRSFRTGEPVLTEFLRRLPVSLALGLSGLTLAILLAIPFGFFSALKPKGIIDRASRFLSIFVQTMPGFWLALILLWFFGVYFKLLRPFSGSYSAYILPIIIISLHSLGVLTRVYRRDLLHTHEQAYFTTALAKGLSMRQACWHHGHRSALYAMLSAVRSEAGWVIGSTATMEILFNLPGISQFLVQSISARDHMVLIAYVMVVALWMMVLNAIILTILSRLDPRAA